MLGVISADCSFDVIYWVSIVLLFLLSCYVVLMRKCELSVTMERLETPLCRGLPVRGWNWAETWRLVIGSGLCTNGSFFVAVSLNSKYLQQSDPCVCVLSCQVLKITACFHLTKLILCCAH